VAPPARPPTRLPAWHQCHQPQPTGLLLHCHPRQVRPRPHPAHLPQVRLLVHYSPLEVAAAAAATSMAALTSPPPPARLSCRGSSVSQGAPMRQADLTAMRPSTARKPWHGGIRPRLLAEPALWRRRRRRRRRRRLGRQRRRICRGLGSARLRQARLVRALDPAGDHDGQMQPGEVPATHAYKSASAQRALVTDRVCSSKEYMFEGTTSTPFRSVSHHGAVGQKQRRAPIRHSMRPGMRANAEDWPAPPARPARQPGGCGRRRAHCSCSLAASFSARRRSLRPRSCRVRSAVSAFISISRCAGPGGQARRAPPPSRAARTRRAVPGQSFARLDCGSGSSGTREQQLCASSHVNYSRRTAAASVNAPSCGGGRMSSGASPTLQHSCTAYGTPAARSSQTVSCHSHVTRLESFTHLRPCQGSSGPWRPCTVTLKTDVPCLRQYSREAGMPLCSIKSLAPHPSRLRQPPDVRTGLQTTRTVLLWPRRRHATGRRRAPRRARLAVQVALRDSHICADALVALHLLLCAAPRTTGR